MNPAGKLLTASLLALLGAACAASFAPTYKEPPCGYQGHSCPNTDHMCCDEGFDCGGNVEFYGCPAGQCCFSAGLAATRADAGRSSSPQRRER